MKLHYDTSEPEVRIEIVPLIDVIFCILTFFILAAVTLTRQTAINVDLPKAASAATQMRQLLIVTVDPIGQIYIEKQPVSPDQLFQAVTNFRRTSPEGTIVLYASRAASYNDVVFVLDQIRAVGGDRVALATLPGSNAPNAAPSTLPGTVPGLEGGGLTLPSAPGASGGSLLSPGLGSPSGFSPAPLPNGASDGLGQPGSLNPSPGVAPNPAPSNSSPGDAVPGAPGSSSPQ